MGRTIESAISLADEDPRGGGDWLRTPALVLPFHTISTTGNPRDNGYSSGVSKLFRFGRLLSKPEM